MVGFDQTIMLKKQIGLDPLKIL